ncbi:MAG: aminoglycoside phosphotransferase family protein [Defluviitaleaceae bacterium]|nr:aminoglycoside phosphotransferase family protein [Defluviitaleaceae bacterium]
MVKEETLYKVLGKKTGAEVIRASFNESELQGGTLGDVRLVKGEVEIAAGDLLPYKVVWKTQKKWERPGDPLSWRREYDLYNSGFGENCFETFRPPTCYHAEMNEAEDEIQLWMEYAEGASGKDLTMDMMEKAAYEIGRFQGKLFTQPDASVKPANFGDVGYLRRDYEQWHTLSHNLEAHLSEYSELTDEQKQQLRDGTVKLQEGEAYEYTYLRTDFCKIPQHLKQMFYDIDDNMDAFFEGIGRLPVVLCHRDYWIENIFHDEGNIRLIDWDTSGWGYLGEDLASLIADDYGFDEFEELCERLIPAYYKGAAEYMDVSAIANGTEKNYIKEMILLKFGYRQVQDFIFADEDEEEDRVEAVKALQKIYEMK